jgi:release factor glutamine methyltransferase
MSTIAVALRSARQRLAPLSESASGDAQTLLCHVLGVERAWLLAHPEHLLTPEQSTAFEALVARCAAGEPLPYVLGRRAWYAREFIVTPDVLIPRPETELLLEAALEWAADAYTTDAQLGVPTESDGVGTPFLASVVPSPIMSVGTRNGASGAATDEHAPIAVDVGTGSGILAVTFAALRPAWQVYAVDISGAALDVARRNAVLHKAQARIKFAQSDLLAEWDERMRIDLLMANLPYIPSADVPMLPVARHEPRLALDGGEDGLRLIRRLLAQATRVMHPGGLILLEIETRQGEAVTVLARAAFPDANIAVLRDYAGHERIVRVLLAS